MKKTFSFILAFSLTLLSFAGCDNNIAGESDIASEYSILVESIGDTEFAETEECSSLISASRAFLKAYMTKDTEAAKALAVSPDLECLSMIDGANDFGDPDDIESFPFEVVNLKYADNGAVSFATVEFSLMSDGQYIYMFMDFVYKDGVWLLNNFDFDA